MLSCKEITQLTSDYLDHELGFIKRMQFRMHLFICKNCQRFVEQFKTTVAAAKNLKTEKPSDETVNNQVATLLKIRDSHTHPK